MIVRVPDGDEGMLNLNSGAPLSPGRDALEAWMARTGLSDVTTPAHRGLQVSPQPTLCIP